MISIPSVVNFITIDVLRVCLTLHSFYVVVVHSILGCFIVTGCLFIMVHSQ